MTIALIVSALAGMAIGLRSKVLMTLPAIVIAIICAVLISRGGQTWTIFWAAALSATAVQIGYLCGSLAISIFRERPEIAAANASATANNYARRLITPAHKH